VSQEPLLANEPVLYWVFSLEINERKHDSMKTILNRRVMGIKSTRVTKETKNLKKKGINLRRFKQKRIF
jgi:hypothetical protein